MKLQYNQTKLRDDKGMTSEKKIFFKTMHTKIDTIKKNRYLQKLTQNSKTNCAKSSDKNTTCAFIIT